MAMTFADSTINLAELAMGLLGGLAMFLYGMHKMSDGMKAAAGEGMKTLLGRLTGNRFSAATTGAVVTAVIQSSSVTTVLVVGFVSAGLMTLNQSVGVIMGANIGTTVTAQIVAFKVTKYAWAMVAVGFALWSFSKRDAPRHYGTMIMGLGLLFLGMDQMSSATHPLRTYDPFINLMQRMDNPLLGILVGAGFTALVQSSSATTGIVIMLASQGFLTLEAGIALAIGANIGTCFTAMLAAIGKPPEAVRAAVVHVLFNIIGALLWVGFIGWLADLAVIVSPKSPTLEGTERLAAETPRQIANANTLFNVANTFLLIWFTGPIARLATKMVPAKPVEEPVKAEPKYLEEVFLKTPAIALDRVRMEIGHMGEYVVAMLEKAGVVVRGTSQDLDRLADMDDDVDRLHMATLEYLRQLSRQELREDETRTAEELLAIANYVESTGDLISTTLVAQGRQRLAENLVISEQTGDLIRPLYLRVAESMNDALKAVVEDDRTLAADVQSRKAEIHRAADEINEHLSRRLVADEPNRLKVFRFESEIVSQIKRLYYNARKIAELIADEPEDTN